MTSKTKTVEQKQEEQGEFMSDEDNAVITDFLTFMNKSVSPYHAVQSCIEMLGDSFQRLDERDEWKVPLKAGRYYFTRNQSTICAFVVPPKWRPGNGFTIMGAHTDSPVFRVKPKSKKVKQETLCVGVESYAKAHKSTQLHMYTFVCTNHTIHTCTQNTAVVYGTHGLTVI